MPGANVWILRRCVGYIRRSTGVNQFPDTADAKSASPQPILLYCVVGLQGLQVSFWTPPASTRMSISLDKPWLRLTLDRFHREGYR
jgi:hypothetical protein